MPRGIALTIGLNAVDPKHYAGWSGELNACEADAEDMAAIAGSNEFEVATLLTKQATREAVMNGITTAANSLKSGDIFMISYSGHGGQLPDLNGDEPDRCDETWCLYDGEMVDDELYDLYGKFSAGVRVLVFSDSCHSGSVVKMAYYRGTADARSATPGAPAVKYRFMPPDVAFRTYRKNKDFYDDILNPKGLRSSHVSKSSLAPINASILLISGCQDNQYSADGPFNGLFTSQLLLVWGGGAFLGDYRVFHKMIVKRMPPDQTPNFYLAGAPNPSFEKEKPFTI